MPNVTVIAFNYGNAGTYVNGPGMCLHNFVSYAKERCNIKVFSKLPSIYNMEKLNSFNLGKSINNSDTLIHWSGLDKIFKEIIHFASSKNLKIIIGPNVLDTVHLKKEKAFLKNIKFDRILTPSNHIRYLVSQKHNIPLSKISVFRVGPDIERWRPVPKTNEILWKGNSNQFVKGIDLALEIQKKLPEYKFRFLGYPKPYNYSEHIGVARTAKLYFSTSLSETMSLSTLEQLSTSTPVIINPKVHLDNINYNVGIVADRTVTSYVDAIREIMENQHMYDEFSANARQYVIDNFGPERVYRDFESFL